MNKAAKKAAKIEEAKRRYAAALIAVGLSNGDPGESVRDRLTCARRHLTHWLITGEEGGVRIRSNAYKDITTASDGNIRWAVRRMLPYGSDIASSSVAEVVRRYRSLLAGGPVVSVTADTALQAIDDLRRTPIISWGRPSGTQPRRPRPPRIRPRGA